MIGFVFENISLSKQDAQIAWLTDTFGESTEQTWYLDQDYDLETLVLTEEIAVMYKLKWR